MMVLVVIPTQLKSINPAEFFQFRSALSADKEKIVTGKRSIHRYVSIYPNDFLLICAKEGRSSPLT